MTLAENWLVAPGQCLVCGGRGGYPRLGGIDLCSRCEGTGRDPQRGEDWYMDLILPLQTNNRSTSDNPCGAPSYPNRKTARQTEGSHYYHCPSCHQWHPLRTDLSLPPVVAIHRGSVVHRGGRHNCDWPLCLRRSRVVAVGRYEATERPVTCKRCKELS